MRVTPLWSKSGPALLLPTLPLLRTWVSLSCCGPLGPLGTPKSLNRYKHHHDSLRQVFLLTTSQLVSVFIFFLSGVLLHKKHVQFAQGSQIRGSGTRSLSSAARLQHRASPTKAQWLSLAVSRVSFLLKRPPYPCDNMLLVNVPMPGTMFLAEPSVLGTGEGSPCALKMPHSAGRQQVTLGE